VTQTKRCSPTLQALTSTGTLLFVEERELRDTGVIAIREKI
jgi:hypothetical protein